MESGSPIVSGNEADVTWFSAGACVRVVKFSKMIGLTKTGVILAKIDDRKSGNCDLESSDIQL